MRSPLFRGKEREREKREKREREKRERRASILSASGDDVRRRKKKTHSVSLFFFQHHHQQKQAKCLLCLLYSQLCLGTPEGYVAIPSTVEGGAAPVPKGLSVLLYPRAGAPEVAAAAEEEAKAAAAAASSSDAAAAAAPSAPASSSAAAPAPAAAHSIPLRILYGSNGGTCEAFASSLAQRAAQLGFAATAEPLDAAADGSLAAEGGSTKGAAVAIITATYNGMPPDNAAKFLKWLASLESDGKGGENGKE